MCWETSLVYVVPLNPVVSPQGMFLLFLLFIIKISESVIKDYTEQGADEFIEEKKRDEDIALSHRFVAIPFSDFHFFIYSYIVSRWECIKMVMERSRATKVLFNMKSQLKMLLARNITGVFLYHS